MKNGWLVGIGSVFASSVIFPLILHLYTVKYVSKNTALPVLPVYMERSVSIKTVIPAMSDSRERRITLRYTKQGDDRSEITDRFFYLPAYKKYFVFEQFDVPDDVYREDTLIQRPVMIRINKDDLINPALGSKAKPVPVFNIWRANPLFMKNGETGRIDTLYPNFNQNKYRYNVYMYLTYIMPKAEFKRRFPDK